MSQKGTLIGLACLAAAVALPIAMVAPGRSSEQKKKPFWGKNFAHRGLHTLDKSVPENSLPAFRHAVEEGYGMELDVQLSKDGEVVVFHDDDLLRVCGVDKPVDALTLAELKELRLCGTEERIPLFSEVLETVAGKTPLIVELKNGRRNRELCQKTYALLKKYDGEYCVESFNPLIVTWFRAHAPEILRGQLAQPTEFYTKDHHFTLRNFVLSHTLLNALARPQFIAYKIGPRPLLVRLSELLGAMRVGWTSHSRSSEKGRDTVIFEFYRPDRRYK